MATTHTTRLRLVCQAREAAEAPPERQRAARPAHGADLEHLGLRMVTPYYTCSWSHSRYAGCILFECPEAPAEGTARARRAP